MERVSSDIIVLSTGPYKPDIGQYGIRKIGGIKWHFCRELFHRDIGLFWARGFYFSCKKEQRELIALFIEEIENVLKLKVRTRFQRTNISTIMFIRPAPFWFSQSMRFSLFTIMIRAGIEHKENQDIDVTIRNNEYLRETSRAVKMFLSGRTRYVGWYGWMPTRRLLNVGWYSAFSSIPCCRRRKCQHRDRRCRRKIEAMLVPWWQFFPIHVFARLYRWSRRIISRFIAPQVVQSKDGK